MRFRSAHHAPTIAATSMDRTTSFLIATAVLLSGAMFVLLAIWVLNLETHRPITFGGGDMGIEIFVGTPTPPVPQQVTSPEQVTDDPSARQAASEWVELLELIGRVSTIDATLVNEPPGGMAGSGPASDGTHGDVITVPPSKTQPERWAFVIDGIANLAEYARMLQQFRIEVGTFDTNNDFAYLENITRPRPTVRRATTSRDERFFTLWQSGSLMELDAQLFRNAGIDSRDGQFVHFFPAELEQRLAGLERRATQAAGRKSRDIRRTWFTIERTEAGFRFRVARQRWADRKETTQTTRLTACTRRNEPELQSILNNFWSMSNHASRCEFAPVESATSLLDTRRSDPWPRPSESSRKPTTVDVQPAQKHARRNVVSSSCKTTSDVGQALYRTEKAPPPAIANAGNQKSRS